MKKHIKLNKLASIILLSLAALSSGTLFQACEKNDSGGGAPPEVSYIRITDPAKSDSLITSAYMGSTIAIMGQNMQDVNQIWFNDQKAYINSSFVTSTTIIITVPNTIPGVVTNQMYIITTNTADTLKVPFSVVVPAPRVDEMVCEYVKDGDIAVIKGNFFINDPNTPLQVLFPGNIPGTIKEVAIDEIRVTVPAGAGVGPIQVKSIYGSTRSKFFFRDDRNILLDFDTKTAAGGWRSGVIANSSPAPVSGNYVKFNGSMGGAAGATWNEDAFSFNLWPSSNGRPNEPFFTGDMATAVIKFECFVTQPWQASALQMIFTPYSVSGTNSYIADNAVPRGLWIPWKQTGTFKTEGWTTITLPLSEFKFTASGGACANPLTAEMLRGLTFFVFNGGVAGTDCTVSMCIDNIRVVN
jgi:hypothetical protein